LDNRIGVVLSTDMKNSVIVNGETWDEVQELLPQARELYASLIEEFGVKTYGKATTPSRGSQATSRGASVNCADCGEPIKGNKDQKTQQFNSPETVAEWGVKKYGRALCLNNVNGCYAKAGSGSAPARSRRPARQQPEDELDF
jgi:hypothetical protein